MDLELVRRVASIADRQAGAISAGQLDELQLTALQVRALRRNGFLVPAAARVFVMAGAPPTIDRELHVGLLCLGPDAVVSHWAAARLHGFDGAPADAVAVTVPRRRRGRKIRFEIHTTAG